MNKIDHKDAKVGDTLVVSESNYSTLELYKVEVVKRSATRLTTKLKDRERQWNLDGTPYPRETGYYGAYRKLLPASEENLKACDRTKAIHRVVNSVYKLDGYIRKHKWDAGLVEPNISNLADTLEKCVKLLTSEEKS